MSPNLLKNRFHLVFVFNAPYFPMWYPEGEEENSNGCSRHVKFDTSVFNALIEVSTQLNSEVNGYMK